MRKCPVMLAFKDTGQCVPIFCGQWACDHCAIRLAHKWAAIARHGIKIEARPAYFWTLTMGRKIKKAKYAYAKLPKMFDALRKAMQRRYGKWLYIAFVEGQPKRGNMPHFHIITFEKSPTKRLKDFVTKFGFGFSATQTEITGRKAAGYVAKYATKQNPDTPKGFRRVRAARQWPKRPKRAKFDELIVMSKKENLTEYFTRVARLTGLSYERVMSEYYTTLLQLQSDEI